MARGDYMRKSVGENGARVSLGKRLMKCRYCKGEFWPRRTGGSEQHFCCSSHRKLFWKSGSLPFDKLALRMEQHVERIVGARLSDLQSQLNELRAKMGLNVRPSV